MDRRQFFRTTLGKASQAVVEHVDRKVARHAARWVRPPFAQPEIEFLLVCTRCNECIEACPHDVIFPLPPRCGTKFTGTPALDLVNRGCHLCEDWPCVASCKSGALKPPESTEDDPPPVPVLARAWIDTTQCLPYQGPECGACAGSCPVPDALLWDGPRPRIDIDVCVGCGLCREACITEPKAVSIESLYREAVEDGDRDSGPSDE